MMKRQELLDWVLQHAIEDRQSYLSAIAGCGMDDEEADTRAEIEQFETWLARKGNLKTSGDTLFRAFVYAEQDRGAFLEASHYEYGKPYDDPYVVEIADELKQVRALRMKVWGETVIEAQMRTATAIPLTEFLRQSSAHRGSTDKDKKND
jgi:hypothetical protein